MLLENNADPGSYFDAFVYRPLSVGTKAPKGERGEEEEEEGVGGKERGAWPRRWGS